MVASYCQEYIITEIYDKVAEKGVATQLRIADGDGYLDTQSGDNQALMRGHANPEQERGPIGVPQLVRRINPPQQTGQHRQIPRHTGDGDAVDNDRLFPHEPVETQDQARRQRRDQADSAFPFAGHALEFFDALHEHATTPRNDEREQAAGHRPGEGLSDRDTPGHVPERQKGRPQPAINRPHRVTGRVRNPRVERAGYEFAGVFQRQLRRQGQEVHRPDHPEGDGHRQPVDLSEQRRHRRQRGHRRWL